MGRRKAFGNPIEKEQREPSGFTEDREASKASDPVGAAMRAFDNLQVNAKKMQADPSTVTKYRKMVLRMALEVFDDRLDNVRQRKLMNDQVVRLEQLANGFRNLLTMADGGFRHSAISPALPAKELLTREAV